MTKMMSIKDEGQSLSRKLGSKPSNRQQFLAMMYQHYMDKHLALLDLPSVSAQRSWLHETFHWHHFPRDAAASELIPIRRILQLAPPTSLVQISLHALCLVQLHAVSDDSRVLHQAHRTYVRAIQLLQRTLARPITSHSDEVLVGTHLLTVVEKFKSISEDDAARRQHIAGASSLLDQRHRAAPPSELSLYCLTQHQFHKIQEGIILRRAHSSKELEILSRTFILLGHYSGFVPLGLRTGALLEDIDQLLAGEITGTSAKIAVAKAMALLVRLQEYEREMSDLMKAFAEDQPMLPRKVLSIHDFDDRLRILGDTSSVLTGFFAFPSFEHAAAHIRWWGTLCLVRQAHRRILKRFPCLNLPGSYNQHVERSVESSAVEVLMAVPYLCQQKHGVQGFGAVLGSLQVLAEWYEETSQADMVLWCKRIATNIEVKVGIRVPLCLRLVDEAGMGEAHAFRMNGLVDTLPSW